MRYTSAKGTRSPTQAACSTERTSAQIIALRSGRACRSSGTQPIICPLKVMQAISSPRTPVCASSARVDAHTACHQSSGFCSAQPVCAYSVA